MDDALLAAIVGRLDDDPVAEPVADLILAALEDDEALDRAQEQGHGARPKGESPDGTARPAGAYLGPLGVTGFRGIGTSVTLPLQPGPGLTLVIGRNGSGKSSFAEALELLLTGELRRWADRSATWREGWRNLHGGDTPAIEAQLMIEGARGTSVLRRTWPSEGALDSGTTVLQVAGEKQASPERLGWAEALTAYRPFLSHVELEAMLGKPSDLYDILALVLGLDDLWDAVARLDKATKAAGVPLAAAKKQLTELLGDLSESDDERARACHEALSGKAWDLAEAERLAAGVIPPGSEGDLDRLRRLAQLWAPSLQDVAEAAAALRNGAEHLDTVAATDAGRALALADLLESALAHYHDHGDGPCPVCGRVDAMNEAWRSSTEDEVARLRAEATAASEAQTAAAAARSRAVQLLAPPPAGLEQVAGVDLDPLLAAWQTWADPPGGDGAGGLLALAEHLEKCHPALSAAADGVRTRAQVVLEDREDRWAPIAAKVAAWCAGARSAQARADRLPDLRAASKWMGKAVDELRNERLAPLAEQAGRVWAELRQESNIELGAIRLTGSKTRRQVDFDLRVDGTDGPGLGVLSQGEVNALALSLFIPRVTLSASPFRFLVIDDPVQAMDPSKVDGLARVLHDVAATRQVVVLTHDDRLPEAVRRLGLASTILELTRRPESVVEVRAALDPPGRAIEDAVAVSADASLPHVVSSRVVGGLCRVAVEAAFTEAVRRRQLGAGVAHTQVEEALGDCRTFMRLAALALFGDSGRSGDVLGRLRSWGGGWAADTFQALNRSAHQPYAGDSVKLIGDTRKLVRKIRDNL